MKYIVIGFEGFIFSVAYHLQNEGCEVLVGQVIDSKNIFGQHESETRFEKKQRLSQYDNILKKYPIETLFKKLTRIRNPSDYFVICESNTMFRYAARLEKLGFQGNFPTEEDRLFEIDRKKAKDFVDTYYPHLKVAQNEKFTSIKKAEAFLQNTKKLWVLKSQTDSIATFVPHTEDVIVAKKQIIERLQVNKDTFETAGFLLEELIPNIVELTPEKLYYNGKPLGISIMFENKQIGSGNISYQVNCAGDIVFPVSMQSKIHDICFPSIIDEMAKQHKGLFIWDASLLINSKTDEIYFGEFCPNRFGFNSFLTTLAQMPSVHWFFEQVVAGKNPFTFGTVGISLMFFNLLQDPDTNLPLADVAINIPKEIEKHVWLQDAYRKKTDVTYYTTGYDKHVGVVTASKKTFQESVDAMYHSIHQVDMNDVYYRPEFDFVSKNYSTSLLNRLSYCVEKKLFTLPFNINK